MKTKLAAFDFDFTIKEYGSMKNVVYQVFGLAKLFPDKRIPEEYLKILKEGGQWGQYFKTVQGAVNDLGVTKNEVIEAIANDGNLIEGTIISIYFSQKKSSTWPNFEKSSFFLIPNL